MEVLAAMVMVNLGKEKKKKNVIYRKTARIVKKYCDRNIRSVHPALPQMAVSPMPAWRTLGSARPPWSEADAKTQTHHGKAPSTPL